MSLSNIGCASLKHLLIIQLQAAIGLYRERETLYTQAQQLSTTEENLPLSVGLMGREAIPLKRFWQSTGILYRSSVALKLAPLWNLPALEIAAGLARYLCASADTNQENITLQSFTIQVTPPGLIEFQLTDLGIALWLQFLVNTECGQFPIPNSQFPIPNSQSLSSLAIQYAHARCCSLLRLGEREGLILLGDFPSLRIVEPDVIPWLNEDSIRLVDPAERALIAQVLGLLDELDGWGQPDWVKLAIALSQTWESFYSGCRIFGEVKTQTPHLAQARLGLVAATRSILRSLLQNRLFILAPTEL